MWPMGGEGLTLCLALFFSSSELTEAFKELSQTVPDASDIPDEPPKLGAWMMARNVAELTIEAYSGGLWGLFTVSVLISWRCDVI